MRRCYHSTSYRELTTENWQLILYIGHIAGVGRYGVTPLDLGDLTIPIGTPMGGRILPVQAFLITHPTGAILFDTGLGADHAAFDQRLTPTRRSLEAALSALDLKADDVVAVVNCHLHYDHCGANPLFRGVPVFVQAREYHGLGDLDFAITDRVDVPGADLRLLEGEARIMPGLRIVPTSGHTPGHQSLVIEDSDGPVIFAGQAAYTVAEFADPEAEPARGARTAWDRREFLKSIAYLKSLNPRRVYFSHDAGIWQPDAR